MSKVQTIIITTFLILVPFLVQAQIEIRDGALIIGPSAAYEECDQFPEVIRDTCYSTVAGKKNDPDGCSYAGKFKQSCLKNIFLETGNLAVCDLLENREQIEECIPKPKIDVPQDCLNFSNFKEQQDCIIEFAIPQDNPFLCEFFETPKNQESCFYKLAILSGNIGLCKKATSSQFHSDCRWKAVEKIANLDTFPTDIEEGIALCTGDDYCAKRIATMKKDHHYCKYVNSYRTRNSCYRETPKAFNAYWIFHYGRYVAFTLLIVSLITLSIITRKILKHNLTVSSKLLSILLAILTLLPLNILSLYIELYRIPSLFTEITTNELLLFALPYFYLTGLSIIIYIFLISLGVLALRRFIKFLNINQTRNRTVFILWFVIILPIVLVTALIVINTIILIYLAPRIA